MIEIYGDIWDTKCDVICLTTNGDIKKNGAAVMGRGVAYQAKVRYPGIEHEIGSVLKDRGNHVSFVGFRNEPFIVFPVKHHWHEKADLELIARSTSELEEAIQDISSLSFVLPRPGCGNGQRTWEGVKPIVEVLPDNVYVISRVA
jgi:hypothetical protein